jgi:hypothetical protein
MYKDTPPHLCPPRIRELIVLDPRTWNFEDSFMNNNDLFDLALSKATNADQGFFSSLPTFSPNGHGQSVTSSTYDPQLSYRLPHKPDRTPLGQSLGQQNNQQGERWHTAVKPRPIFNRNRSLTGGPSANSIPRTNEEAHTSEEGISCPGAGDSTKDGVNDGNGDKSPDPQNGNLGIPSISDAGIAPGDSDDADGIKRTNDIANDPTPSSPSGPKQSPVPLTKESTPLTKESTSLTAEKRRTRAQLKRGDKENVPETGDGGMNTRGQLKHKAVTEGAHTKKRRSKRAKASA